MAEHGPTERGLEALAWLLCQWDGEHTRADWDVNAGGCRVYYTEQARQAAAALHDPSLGLDRSVPLRAVVEMLRQNATLCVTKEAEYFNRTLADKIEREFGGQG